MRSLSLQSRINSGRSLQFERLEARQLLSASPSAGPAPLAGAALAAPANAIGDGVGQSAAVSLPTAKLARIVGHYSGSIVVPGLHIPLKATITQETATGAITGTLRTPANPRVRAKITGEVLAGNEFSFTVSGGAIAGTGTGTIATNGRHVTLTVNFTLTRPVSATGTLTLRKVL
jgi:hypothetical protein